MGKKLKDLEQAGAVDLGSLSDDEQKQLEALLTDDDVAALAKLNQRIKDDATLGPLGMACTRHRAED